MKNNTLYSHCAFFLFLFFLLIAFEKSYSTSFFQILDLLKGTNTEQIKDLASSHFFFALILCFFAGILTSFTPCVYPMIPITISIFASAAKSRTPEKYESRAFNPFSFRLALIYVAGMATTYSIMGLIIGKTGSLFGKILQSPFVLAFLMLLFLMLALGQLGLFKIALPGSWRTKLSSLGSTQNFMGIFIMGIVSGLIVSPCVGPVIAGILAFVFESSNAVKGFFYFLSFSLGLGILFLLIGGFSGLVNRLPRSGAWMTRINTILALLLIIASGYYGILLIKQTGLLKHEKPNAEKRESLDWQSNEVKAFEKAINLNMPIIVDFTAEWCAVCYEIDEKLFKNPIIIEKLKGFIPLRIDVTQENPENSATLKKYGVLSLPTIAFINNKGEILAKPRIHGLLETQKFLNILNAVSPTSSQ